LVIRRHSRFSVWLLAVAAAAAMPSTPALAAGNAITSSPLQSNADIDPNVRSLDEYMQGGTMEVSPLGLELRQDQRELKSGESAKGLLIVAVTNGSPSANAGLEAVQEAPRQVLAGMAVAGSMVFPPAIILLPLFASLPIGQDGDLIIAVDGSRVRNVLDFEDAIHNAQPGEIIYLTIIRDGSRLQVQVNIPPLGALPGQFSKVDRPLTRPKGR
jgi:S1-C subfamily serine protease